MACEAASKPALGVTGSVAAPVTNRQKDHCISGHKAAIVQATVQTVYSTGIMVEFFTSAITKKLLMCSVPGITDNCSW